MTNKALNDFLTSCQLEQYTPQALTHKAELVAEISRANQQGYSLVEQELE